MTTKITYHACGAVRGPCGHAHRSIRTALNCVYRDAKICRDLGGGSYSDRVVRHTSGESLSARERDLLDDAHYDRYQS